MLHLSTYYRTASTLPIYSIAKGYSYINPNLQPKSKSKSGISSNRTSRAASPTGSVTSLSSSKPRDGEAKNDDFEIGRSFQLTLNYADEYMDENPLIGEPGNFKLSSTSRNIREKELKEKERERLAAEREKKVEVVKEESQKPSTVSSPAPAPAPVKTTAIERKGTLGKGKSPTSAGSEGGKKRRKSKAPITPGVVGSGS
jgi:mediator of RNA polymerase II transcription subunit 6